MRNRKVWDRRDARGGKTRRVFARDGPGVEDSGGRRKESIGWKRGGNIWERCVREEKRALKNSDKKRCEDNIWVRRMRCKTEVRYGRMGE